MHFHCFSSISIDFSCISFDLSSISIDFLASPLIYIKFNGFSIRSLPPQPHPTILHTKNQSKKKQTHFKLCTPLHTQILPSMLRAGEGGDIRVHLTLPPKKLRRRFFFRIVNSISRLGCTKKCNSPKLQQYCRSLLSKLTKFARFSKCRARF